MFTGIITAVSPILESQSSNDGLKLTIKTPKGWSDLIVGESINTNGACLTVGAKTDNSYEVFLMPETLQKTTFGQHVPPAVNLERALGVSDRFGGHFVQGHVDATGTVSRIDTSNGYVIRVTFPASFRPYLIAKGSITVDGAALTVVELNPDSFSVALIPHTLAQTTLKNLQEGDEVNLEFDMLGKYVINHMEQLKHASR